MPAKRQEMTAVLHHVAGRKTREVFKDWTEREARRTLFFDPRLLGVREDGVLLIYSTGGYDTTGGVQSVKNGRIRTVSRFRCSRVGNNQVDVRNLLVPKKLQSRVSDEVFYRTGFVNTIAACALTSPDTSDGECRPHVAVASAHFIVLTGSYPFKEDRAFCERFCTFIIVPRSVGGSNDDGNNERRRRRKMVVGARESSLFGPVRDRYGNWLSRESSPFAPVRRDGGPWLARFLEVKAMAAGDDG